MITTLCVTVVVAPARERELKCLHDLQAIIHNMVAPVRERGLELSLCLRPSSRYRRSHKGAWIEIRNTVGFSVLLTQITHSD